MSPIEERRENASALRLRSGGRKDELNRRPQARDERLLLLWPSAVEDGKNFAMGKTTGFTLQTWRPAAPT
jgi:hypothetical protein